MPQVADDQWRIKGGGLSLRNVCMFQRCVLPLPLQDAFS
jgi:hypothetical protein